MKTKKMTLRTYGETARTEPNLVPARLKADADFIAFVRNPFFSSLIEAWDKVTAGMSEWAKRTLLMRFFLDLREFCPAPQKGK